MAKRERTEFEQARRKRAQKRLLRRLGILAVIGAVVALALAARTFLYEADLTTRLQDFFASPPRQPDSYDSIVVAAGLRKSLVGMDLYVQLQSAYVFKFHPRKHPK